MKDIEEEIQSIKHRLSQLEIHTGFNKDGTTTGNGMYNSVKELEEDIEELTKYINQVHQSVLDINKELNHYKDKVKTIEDTANHLKTEAKDSITLTTISKWKNVLIGIAAAITAFYVVGKFLYSILHNLIQGGVIK